MSKQWKTAEINYLKRYAGSKRLDELAQRFATDEDTIRAKLAELGLESKEGAVGSPADDPHLDTFGAALEALHAGKWKAALTKLEKVMHDSDLPELVARAEQYAAICRSRLAESDAEDAETDPFVRAVVLKNQGQLAEALGLVESDGDGKERFVYLEASIHALEQRFDKAAELLGRAIELNRENRVHAFHDPDFAALRQQGDHDELFGIE